MSFKKAQEGCKQIRFRSPAAKLVCPDSGQVDEPLSPPSITKRCRKRGKGDSLRVRWRIVKQGLTFGRKLVGVRIG